MVCFHPLKGYRKPGGGIAFSNRDGYVDRHIELACGQCRGCRLAKAQEWSLRCVHESELHEKNSFITLTYNDQNLPPDGGLVVKHWQEFAKRLRRKAGPFRFLHCGEYGDMNYRPHYHACIFGLDFSEDRVLIKKKGDHELFKSDFLEERWGKGFVTVGHLTRESAAYVARYVMKKAIGVKVREDDGPRRESLRRINVETGEEYYVRSEYATMSRRPGLGAKWIEKFHKDVYPHDEVVLGGRVHRPPKYYDKYLESNNAKLMEELKEKRRRKSRTTNKDRTPERLKVRETVAEARLGHLSRNL